MPQNVTPDAIEALVRVVLWALGIGFAGMLLIAAGPEPWRWAWRELRGAWRYFVQANWLGYGRFADADPDPLAVDAGRRPDAADRVGISPDQLDPAAADLIPAMIRAWGALDDAQRLAVLAGATDADGAWLYAETRVARFIGGRVEDRAAEVRAARGEDREVEPAGRQIPMRDARGERMVRV